MQTQGENGDKDANGTVSNVISKQSQALTQIMLQAYKWNVEQHVSQLTSMEIMLTSNVSIVKADMAGGR